MPTHARSMSQICPHCHHARKDSEAHIPDWQCPACEKAYAKRPPQAAPPSAVIDHQPERRGGGLLIGLLITILLIAALGLSQRGSPPEVSRPPLEGQPVVTLYSTEWCGYCAATRSFFKKNGIQYTELDIEKNSSALNAYRRLGGQGVPVVEIDREVIHGFNESGLRQLLRPWLRP